MSCNNRVFKTVMAVTGLVLSLTISACSIQPLAPGVTPATSSQSTAISLSSPVVKGTVSLEETLEQRRSVRSFTAADLTMQEVSQLLWAAQGQTSAAGGRSAPSAGALYPLEVYMVAGRVQGLAAGIYKYGSEKHILTPIKEGDLREPLSAAALGEASVKNGSICLIIAGVYERTTSKYGDRGIRYVHLEAGHAAQNVCLEVTALGLGAVTIGAFDDENIKTRAGLAANETPLYLIPVGRK